MPATTSDTKTVNNAVAPHLSADTLEEILAIPVESLTIAQLRTIEDALSRCSGSGDTTKTVGSFLS